MNSIGIFLKNKQEIKIEKFTFLSGNNVQLVIGIEDQPDKVFLNEDISLWVLYESIQQKSIEGDKFIALELPETGTDENYDLYGEQDVLKELNEYDPDLFVEKIMRSKEEIIAKIEELNQDISDVREGRKTGEIPHEKACATIPKIQKVLGILNWVLGEREGIF